MNSTPIQPLTIGQIYTTTGTTGQVPIASGSSPNITWGTTSVNTSPWITYSDNTNIKPNTLHVKGDSEFEGNIILQGKNLKESLDKIEEKLAILHPNEELEERWEDLRRLRKEYMAIEAEIKEKEKMWAILKR